VLQSHVSAVSSLSFSLDGKVLLSGGRDRVVNAWRLDTHTLLKTLPLYEVIRTEN
jgi:U3 small nucleolar RNA-associated protein 13